MSRADLPGNVADRLRRVLVREEDQAILRDAVDQGIVTSGQANEIESESDSSLLDAPSPISRILRERGWVGPEALAKLRDAQRKRGRASSQSPSSSPPVPPVKLEKYELLERVGRGGMGEVWRAKDLSLGRSVAIKFLKHDDADEIARFLREARTAAQLSHPSIVPIHETGEAGGRHYIVMEFVEGMTLDRLRFSPGEAAGVMREVALATQYAHDQSVIHRDLKPQNLMRRPDGQVRVMDFGLARSLEAGSTLTQSGDIVGTPAYMAPEQAMGLPCDVRSDVYALGATLYELLASRAPFRGESPLEVLRKVADTKPETLHKVYPTVSKDLSLIVRKAMDRNPSNRYATAGEMAEDLRRFAAGEPVLARSADGLRPAVKAAIGLGLGMAVLGAVALFWDSGPGINLLEKVDPAQHAVNGTWRWDGDTLVCDRTNIYRNRIMIPYDPPEEYDLVVRGTRISGFTFTVGLVTGPTQVGLVFDSYPERGGRSGLDLIDGKDSFTNEARIEGRVLQDRVPFRIDCSVRKGRVTAKVDGHPFLDWNGDFNRLSLGKRVQIPHPRALHLGGWLGPFRIDEVTLIPISGQGRDLEFPPPGEASEP